MRKYFTPKFGKMFVLLACAILSSVSARSQVAPDYKHPIEQSRKIVAETMTKLKIPGMSVAVAVNGKIVWSEGFGFADLENHVRVSTATRFRIASISKPITAVAMARAYEQGKLDLDVPIQKYVPNFPRKEHEITARQLAGHLSGIRHYRRSPDEEKDDFYNRKKYYKNISEALKIFQDDPLDFTPGTKFGYSSYGYTLLSAAIENASGQDFFTYVQKEIFDPLHMPSTSADDNRKIIPDRTRFYSLDENKNVINAQYIDGSDTWAGGGFLSNPEDLTRFGSAHLKPGFLKGSTLREIFTSQKTSDGKETGTGLGWRTGKDKEGRTFYFHPGENVGGRSYLVVYPDTGVVVAALHNITGVSLGSAADITKLFVAAVEQRTSGKR
ncbi:MAG TPA: serine hydrolase domain-containing protein [Pyrinomonadaceae bacterium]|nr:serine hydrolase domain-containing protein [Pyrinomonadaceae bacterium]